MLRYGLAGTHHSPSYDATRLNEELCLDSVRVLELLVHLELELGLCIPEEAPAREQFATVGGLVDFVLGLPS